MHEALVAPVSHLIFGLRSVNDYPSGLKICLQNQRPKFF